MLAHTTLHSSSALREAVSVCTLRGSEPTFLLSVSFQAVCIQLPCEWKYTEPWHMSVFQQDWTGRN